MSNETPSDRKPETAKPAPIATEHIMQFFAFNHLPEPMQAISKPFADLANYMLTHLPRNQERTKMLNKLLESKDCAVRAFIAKEIS